MGIITRLGMVASTLSTLVPDLTARLELFFWHYTGSISESRSRIVRQKTGPPAFLDDYAVYQDAQHHYPKSVPAKRRSTQLRQKKRRRNDEGQ